ncbi:MAG: methyltransferase domain-containing protein [Bacteroidota bacterium]|nr:methyltransferase domain-containing protein [Bacteroidota bacterium]
MEKTWFADWFDTPYWQLLYSNRNEEEAALFLDNLIDILQVKPNAKIIDAGCGQGRHSRYLAQKGFQVLGIDIAPGNINKAKSLESTANFQVHDMLLPFPEGNQDLVVNLFTSFGYFNSEKEHLDTLQNMVNALIVGGRLVIDFLNAAYVKMNIQPNHEILNEDVHFQLHKYINNNTVFKVIDVTEQGIYRGSFREQVKLFDLNDFLTLTHGMPIKLTHSFTNYQLEGYEKADRLIMIFEKIK